jgi:hypothetical protein
MAFILAGESHGCKRFKEANAANQPTAGVTITKRNGGQAAIVALVAEMHCRSRSV